MHQHPDLHSYPQCTIIYQKHWTNHNLENRLLCFYASNLVPTLILDGPLFHPRSYLGSRGRQLAPRLIGREPNILVLKTITSLLYRLARLFKQKEKIFILFVLGIIQQEAWAYQNQPMVVEGVYTHTNK